MMMDLGEFTRACAKLGIEMDVHNALGVFDGFDPDDNGYINYDEFKAFAESKKKVVCMHPCCSRECAHSPTHRDREASKELSWRQPGRTRKWIWASSSARAPPWAWTSTCRERSHTSTPLTSTATISSLSTSSRNLLKRWVCVDSVGSKSG